MNRRRCSYNLVSSQRQPSIMPLGSTAQATRTASSTTMGLRPRIG